MKIIIILMSFLALNINSSNYVLEISKESYDKVIKIETYVDKTILTCDLPEILNEDKTSCDVPVPTCTLPELLDVVQNICINPVEAVNWINTTGDTCNGMRQANFNSNVYFARSKNNIYNTNLEIPEGYHWVSKVEYTNLFNASNVNTKSATIRPYHGQCGISAYPMHNGSNQIVILFKSGGTTGMHTGNYEYHGVSHQSYNYSNGFFGYVLYKD